MGELASPRFCLRAIVLSLTLATVLHAFTAECEAQSIAAGSASGARGNTVFLPISSYAAGESISGLQYSLSWDPRIPVVATGDYPDCVLNSALGSLGFSSAATFTPPGCSGAACTGAILMVIPSADSQGNLPPLPQSSTIHTCRIRISDTAPDGLYVLTVSDTRGANHLGEPRAVAGQSGGVVVGCGCGCS
jgi:hypothetical protein